MNLNNLETVNFVDDDTEIVKQNVITTYEGITGRSLAPADPERLFLEGLAAIIGQQKVLINQTGRQNLLAYAEKDNLDHLGALVETERLPEQPAKTIMEFRIEIPNIDNDVITISTDKRVTPDGKLFFKPNEVIEIKIETVTVDVIDPETELPTGEKEEVRQITSKEAELSIDGDIVLCSVPVTCETPGIIGNNYLPGQIKKLVNPISYVTKVVNKNTTTGGADIEADDAYRLRINNAPSKFSTAGPEAAYEYYAKSSHQEIMDVSVTNPSAGQVMIYVLKSGGELPDDGLISKIKETVNAKTIRPLTDKVDVSGPTEEEYNIDVDYYIRTSDADNITKIKSGIEKAKNEYILWQKSKLGRDISPDTLLQKLITAGAKRITIREPFYKSLTSGQIGKEGTVNLIYKGFEDE